jgi:nitroreductase
MDSGFMELLRGRRSIRRYEDRPVEANKRDLLVEAALRSPSSRGINPWRFVFVEQAGTIDRMSRCKGHGSAFLRDAPLAVAVFGREDESDVWVEDCSIASIVLQLAAESLGLGSCWVQVRNRTREDGSSSSEYLRGLLGLPEGYRAESVIGIGYPAESLPPHPEESLEGHKVHMESWSGE